MLIIVVGGIGFFFCFVEIEDEMFELSLGMVVFYDVGYLVGFEDLDFELVILIFMCVISCLVVGFLMLDLGYKVCVVDLLVGLCLVFLELEDVEEV